MTNAEQDAVSLDDLNSAFTDDELSVVWAYLNEQSAIAEALSEGVPLWHMVPVERIENLPPDVLRQAMDDPDRYPLVEYEKDEAEMPLLKQMRDSHGEWIETEIRRRRAEVNASVGE